ncbi:hypothetical protein DL93DRAFT_2090283 [Clavulina sp. PMI_390]|nr:hypothetical protein DL93DRAFT_2090283 [Clavulina sp. PMI_390]
MDSSLEEYTLQNNLERRNFIRDICAGIWYLHHNQQVHGDLHWVSGFELIQTLLA